MNNIYHANVHVIEYDIESYVHTQATAVLALFLGDIVSATALAVLAVPTACKVVHPGPFCAGGSILGPLPLEKDPVDLVQGLIDGVRVFLRRSQDDHGPNRIPSHVAPGFVAEDCQDTFDLQIFFQQYKQLFYL